MLKHPFCQTTPIIRLLVPFNSTLYSIRCITFEQRNLLFLILLLFIFSLYNIDTFAHKRSDNKMTDSKYFTTTKKGEIFELKSELNSDKKEKKKEAVKKVSEIFAEIDGRFHAQHKIDDFFFYF